MTIVLTIRETFSRSMTVDRPRFLIGRADDCDLRLNNKLISRHHCLLSVRDGVIYLRDLKTRNGTGLNNRAVVGECVLQHGDVIWVAATPIGVSIYSHSDATFPVTMSEQSTSGFVPC